MSERLRRCDDCGVMPGQPHYTGCDIEHCSWCGGQWISCGHSRTRKHDPAFARWTGLWPGAAEAEMLGVELEQFHGRGLAEIFLTKPGRRENEPRLDPRHMEVER